MKVGIPTIVACAAVGAAAGGVGGLIYDLATRD
jgi:hypothetical protein